MNSISRLVPILLLLIADHFIVTNGHTFSFLNHDRNRICPIEAEQPSYVINAQSSINCANFGSPYSIAPTELIQNGCDCPPGFLGLQCEPAACVDTSLWNSQSSVFTPYQKTFGLLITANSYFQNTTNILNIISSLTILNEVDVINTYFVDLDGVAFNSFNTYKDLQNFISWLKIYPTTGYILTTEEIWTVVQASRSLSSVLIITNIGLTDPENETTLSLIAQFCTARQITINIVIAAPVDSSIDVFYNAAFVPLYRLTEQTLGHYVAPYHPLGGLYNPSSPIENVVENIVNSTFSKTLIATGTVNASVAPVIYRGKGTIYVSVFSKNMSAINANLSVDGNLAFEPVFSTDIFQLSKSANEANSTNDNVVLIQTNLNSFSYRIWTRNTDYSAYLGYLSDNTSDATSANPIYGLSNTIVGRINGLQLTSLPTLITSTSTSTINGTYRPCLFNYAFEPLDCSQAATGWITLAYTNFQQTIPYACTKDTSKSLIPPLSKIKKFENSALSNISCTTDSDTSGLQTRNSTSFGLILPVFTSLASFINQLSGSYFNIFGSYLSSTYFTSFVLNTDATGSNDVAGVYDNSTAFVKALQTSLGNSVTSSNCNYDLTQVIKSALTNLSSYSELYIINDRRLQLNSFTSEIYQLAQTKRIKISFILINSTKNCIRNNNDALNYYDLAARTSGNGITTSNGNDISAFFQKSFTLTNSYLVNWNYAPQSLRDFQTVPFFLESEKQYVATVPTLPAATLFVFFANHTLVPPTDNPVTSNLTIGTLLYFNISVAQNNLYYLLLVSNDNTSTTFLFQVFEINNQNNFESFIALTNALTTDASNYSPDFGSSTPLYFVVKNNAATFGNITIKTNGADSDVNQNLIERSGCADYNLIVYPYRWQCDTRNGIYVVQCDSGSETRTVVLTCVYDGQNQCPNGGTLENGVCSCAPGYKGENCEEPICFNGFEIENGICTCLEPESSLYGGFHCEHAKYTCPEIDRTVIYNDLVDTLALVIAGQITSNISLSNANFRKYIIVSYDNSGITVDIFTSQTLAENKLNQLPSSLSVDSRNSLGALKAAVNATSSDKTLLIWLPPLSGSEGQAYDDDILNSIAKKNIEMRSFSKSRSDTYQNISILGNGIPFIDLHLNYARVFEYIGWLNKNEYAVRESQVFTNCTGINVKFPAGEYIITYYNFESNIPSGGNVSYPTQYNGAFSLHSIANSTLCSYLVEELIAGDSRVATTFTPVQWYSSPGYALVSKAETYNLNFNIQKVQPVNSNTLYSSYPSVQSSPINFDNNNDSSIASFIPVTSQKCSYSWTAQFECHLKPSVNRVQINYTNSGLSRTFTTYCLNQVYCSENSVQLSNGECICRPWWSGQDCSIASCLNGGTPVGVTCYCPENFFGSNCEYSLERTVYRNVLIILDVDSFELLQRKNLATTFLNTYNNAERVNFAFATNTNDSSNYAPLSDNNSESLSALSKAEAQSNLTLNTAFQFFNDQLNLSHSSNETIYFISNIYYITNQGLPITFNVDASIVEELNNKGISIYSIVYGDTLIDGITQLSVLGGVFYSTEIDETILEMQTAVQGGSTNPAVVTTTTTPIPPPCWKQETYDIMFYIDTNITDSAINNTLYTFLNNFPNGLNVNDTGNPSTTRLVATAYDSPLTFCSTSLSSFLGNVNGFILRAVKVANRTVDLSTYALMENAFSKSASNNYTGIRDVQTLLVMVTCNANYTNFNLPKQFESQNLKFGFLYFGSGDIKETQFYDDYTKGNSSFIYTVNSTNIESVTNDFYNELCKVNPTVTNTAYVCPRYLNYDGFYNPWDIFYPLNEA